MSLRSARRELQLSLRKLGLPIPWSYADIEREWFGGASLNWDPADVEEAFNRAQIVAGSRWVLGNEIDTAMFAGFAGIGRRGGYNEFLRAYWLGHRAASLRCVRGSRKLLSKVRSGDHSASEELTALSLLRHRHRDTDLELAPPTAVNGSIKHPDFRIRKKGAGWVFVEVTQLNRSQASARVASLLQCVADAVMGVDRPFILEIILDREPSDAEVELLISAAVIECEGAAGAVRQLDTVGRILVKDGSPNAVIPAVEPGDSVPRMALARAVVGPSGANRQVLVRMPYEDQRAEDVLAYEARQLPKSQCGLVMVNVNLQPTAMEFWSKRIPERFNSRKHTRVAGVALFMHATQPCSRGLVWLPHVRLIQNPHAATPLPSWIVSEFDRIRADARALAAS